MPVDSSNFGPLHVLTEHAAHLNGITVPDSTQPPFYELMSGALVWRDETREDTPTEVIWALRLVCAYRTSLMRGQPRAEFATLWEHCLRQFPNWVGFLPERRASDPVLLEIYRRGEVGSRKCLRDFEREELMHNPPMQRTGAAGILSGVRRWFRRGPGR